MASAFKLPDLGEGLTEGEVARWLVAEGQEIAEDDPLVEIQTDKATVEIPSPYGGTVLKILVAEGELAPVGAELVVIGAAGESFDAVVAAPEADGAARVTPTAAPVERVQATPVVRRIAQELGVDLAAVTGTGPGGRVTEDDVRAAAGGGEGRREPLRGVRRVIAEHMARAHREVPPVTWVEECDFEDVASRPAPADRRQSVRGGPRRVPRAQRAARRGRDRAPRPLRHRRRGADRGGLVVPVVRGANEKTIDALASEIAELAERARAGSLGADQLRNSTFTVSSAGKLAGLFQTPIVNYPEVAILSIGRVAPRPVVRDGEVVVRRTGALALTFDHRVVDGARAAAFGLAVIARIEGSR